MAKQNTSLYKKVHHKLSVYKRLLNSGNRVLPDFLIIGSAKSGTTSFFHYLIQHPQVFTPFKKEIHFFDKHYNKGIKWYQLHFPSKKEIESSAKPGITGEATPYYISHPLVPSRVQSTLPDVKLIVLLRNPVDRAFSNYNHMVRMGFETESFEKAIDLESERTSEEFEKLVNENFSYSFKHHHYSYLSRSIYHIEISRWLKYFNPNKFLFINSEDFYSHPLDTYQKSIQFLELGNFTDIKFKKMNSGGDYMKMNPDTRIRLSNFFKPHNEQLYKLIGEEYNWNDF